jgi:hypothetical protein
MDEITSEVTLMLLYPPGIAIYMPSLPPLSCSLQVIYAMHTLGSTEGIRYYIIDLMKRRGSQKTELMYVGRITRQ